MLFIILKIIIIFFSKNIYHQILEFEYVFRFNSERFRPRVLDFRRDGFINFYLEVYRNKFYTDPFIFKNLYGNFLYISNEIIIKNIKFYFSRTEDHKKKKNENMVKG